MMPLTMHYRNETIRALRRLRLKNAAIAYRRYRFYVRWERRNSPKEMSW
jgi:hypothetical protein